MSAPLGWRLLERELDAWKALGRRATLWWRDDDACRDSPSLQALLELARRHRVPVAVAAIAATADATLADAIARSDEATIVQHGYAHANHAPAGERSAELGAHRSLRVRREELERGRERLARAFGGRFVPVLVPPWNRIAADIVPGLPAIGFHGLSCFGPRPCAFAAPRLVQVNAHVDLIAWRRDRQFIGADAAIERLASRLAARRSRETDPDEPTGVLTHHLEMGSDALKFLAELMLRTRDHGAAAWLDVRDAFAAANSSRAPAALTSDRSA